MEGGGVVIGKERALSERVLGRAGAEGHCDGRAGSLRKKSMPRTRGENKAAGMAGMRRTARRKRRALRCAFACLFALRCGSVAAPLRLRCGSVAAPLRLRCGSVAELHF